MSIKEKTITKDIAHLQYEVDNLKYFTFWIAFIVFVAAIVVLFLIFQDQANVISELKQSKTVVCHNETEYSLYKPVMWINGEGFCQDNNFVFYGDNTKFCVREITKEVCE